MLGIWTTGIGRAQIAACLALTLAACSGAAPDPRGLPAPEPRPQRLVAAPRLATGHVYAAPEAAAPLGEGTRTARPAAPLPDLALAIGSGAAATLHLDFVPTFMEQAGDRPCSTERCSDREAVERVAVGRADAALIRGQLCSRDVQRGLRPTQLGVELFALFVPASSGVSSLDPRQVRRIFTGQVTDWRELGFAAGVITPIVPADRGAGERAARLMIPGDRFAASCLAAGSREQVEELLRERPGGVALVRVPAGPPSPQLRAVPIDQVSPSAAAFGYGSYPYGVPLQLVTVGAPTGAAGDLLAFARSGAGRAKASRYLTPTR
ncbi:MAG: substrate-binding domain-containing protein [Planctomycetota bacterium]